MRAAEYLYDPDGAALLPQLAIAAHGHPPGYPGPKGALPLGPPTRAAEAVALAPELVGALDVLTGDAVDEEPVEVFDALVWAAAPVLVRAEPATLWMMRERLLVFARVRW